jgi:hypothetical protein
MPLYVLSLIPRTDDTYDTQIQAFNYTESSGGLKALVDAQSTCRWVDVYPIIVTPDDLNDGIHPDDSGYDRLATHIYWCMAANGDIGWNPGSLSPLTWVSLAIPGYTATAAPNQGTLGGSFTHGTIPATQTANCWDFDNNDLMDFSGAASAHNCLHDGTGSTWWMAFNKSTSGETDTLISTSTAGDANVGMYARGNGSDTLDLKFGNGTLATALTIGTSILGTHYIVVRYDEGQSGDTLSVRLDGVEIYGDSPSISPVATDADGVLRYGSIQGGSARFEGQIAEPGVVASWLSGADLTNLENYLSAVAGGMIGGTALSA